MDEYQGKARNYTWSSRLTRYFLHGLAFSLLLMVFGIVWLFLLLALVIVGLVIGFIIGLFLLFLIMGALNSILTEYIWNIATKSNWTSLPVHGLALFIVLLLASIPSLVINFTVPGWATAAVLFTPYCLIDGYLAKAVASNWKAEEEYEDIP